MTHRTQIAVIGGGPAGLRAAEVAAQAGSKVMLFDGKRSVGRKFLVAGKGGLNLTHGEPFDRFVTRYYGPEQPAGIWNDLLAGFDADALCSWAADLGVETFQASSGRIYPKALKAAPLLRRWIARLKHLGVEFVMSHQWTGLTPGRPHQLHFSGDLHVVADAVVFALGGGSWPHTGSDGGWVGRFKELGIACNPLTPANCGWEYAWEPEVLAAVEGQPLKNITVSAGNTTVAGELLVTRYGLEGGAIYQLGSTLRAMEHPAIHIDFKPTFTHNQLVAKMESARHRLLDEASVRWKLSPAARAILARKSWHDADSLAHEAKHCVISLSGPRPLEEAISSAGGVRWTELDLSLMIQCLPGVFVAGEMIDWEAPTGGYLMQGCFATGSRAGHSASAWRKK